MGVIEEMRRRINKIRWERWRAKQNNKEREKSYFYCWSDVGCGECLATAGIGKPPETAMASVGFSGEFKGNCQFLCKAEGYASSTVTASAWVNVSSIYGNVTPNCKNGRYEPNLGCCYVFWFYAEIYDEFELTNLVSWAVPYTCKLGVGRGFDISEDTCTISCKC